MSDPVEEVGSQSPTAPTRGDSKKAHLQRRIAHMLEENVPVTAAWWTPAGLRPDLELLSQVLALTDPEDVRGGSVATGLDMWAAAMLRASGLRVVRPHGSEPFFVSRLAVEATPTFEAIDRELRTLEEFRVRLE